MPRNKKNQRSNAGTGINARFPPQLQVMPVRSRTIRYVVSTANGVEHYTLLDLFASRVMAATAAAATTASCAYTSVRLRRVCIYSQTNSTASAAPGTEINVRMGGGRLGESITKSAVGTSAVPAFLDVRPRSNMWCGMWHNVGDVIGDQIELADLSTPLFSLQGTEQGDIIDIVFDYVEAAQVNDSFFGVIVVTFATAIHYFSHALAAGGNWLPYGVEPAPSHATFSTLA
jgi:hypothetical protein